MAQIVPCSESDSIAIYYLGHLIYAFPHNGFRVMADTFGPTGVCVPSSTTR
jgi:hypothetical protein